MSIPLQFTTGKQPPRYEFQSRLLSCGRSSLDDIHYKWKNLTWILKVSPVLICFHVDYFSSRNRFVQTLNSYVLYLYLSFISYRYNTSCTQRPPSSRRILLLCLARYISSLSTRSSRVPASFNHCTGEVAEWPQAGRNMDSELHVFSEVGCI